MTDVAVKTSAEPAYTDMSLEELIDARTHVIAFQESDRVKAFLKDIADAAKAKTDLDTMIALRVEENGARKFERDGWRGEFRSVKRGSASVPNPTACRAELAKVAEIPKAALDEALPIVTPEPTVNAKLRELRKLADYGGDAPKIIRAHIAEALSYEAFVIERIPAPMIDVTGSAS